MIVTGMHRSGTSAVTRLLNLLGADLPRNLLPPRSSNPAGFWESRNLVRLHDKVLESMDASWDDTGFLNNFWEDPDVSRMYRENLSDIIEDELPESSFFVLKDPRISRFIPLTAGALTELGIDVKFVSAVRNPLEVAGSLRKRDGFGSGKSLLLWLDYSLRAERMTRSFPSSLFLYEELVEDWRSVVQGIVSTLDLEFPSDCAEQQGLVESFISPELRHHEFELEDVTARSDFCRWVPDAYQALRALAFDRSDTASQLALDSIYDEFRNAQIMFRETLEQNKFLQRRVCEQAADPDRGVLGHDGQEASSSGSSLDDRHALKDLEQECVLLKRRNDKSVGRIDDLSKRLERERSMRRAMRRETRTLRSQFDTVVAERSRYGKEKELLAAEQRQLRVRVDSANEVAKVIREKASRFESEVQALKQSLLWRALLPLREAGRIARAPIEYSRGALRALNIVRCHGLEKARQVYQQRRVLSESALFDVAYYKRKELDATSAGVDPLIHYLLFGGCEGRDPNPLFDSSWYLKEYPDVARSGMNPLVHFQLHGARESRDPHPAFQTGWYRKENPDVAESGINPLRHFLAFGGFEGRDPNPLFRSSWYLEQNPAVREAAINPLVHYLEFGWREGRWPSPEFDTGFYQEVNSDVAERGVEPLGHWLRFGQIEGRRAVRTVDGGRAPYDLIRGKRHSVDGWKTILLVAHFVGDRLFGAERSFLDMLEGLSALNYNVVVALPSDVSHYTDIVRRYCDAVVIFDYKWWRKNHPFTEDVVGKFETVISEFGVDAVHVNTIMLREPLTAAARRRIPSIVHVRELIREDKWLAQAIGETPSEIIKQVVEQADWIFANSEATREAFSTRSRTFVIQNPVSLEAMDIPNDVDPKNVRFGIISSNIQKKGIEDLVELARRCEFSVPNAQFVAIGPETSLIKRMRRRQSSGEIPANVRFEGYVESPVTAIGSLNVVLNLSHFKESFGRTIAEAMAARRPAIAYEWGALPELIDDGVTGFLVPYREPGRIAPIVETLCGNPRRIVEMGKAARAVAARGFSKRKYSERLEDAYFTIFRNPLPNDEGGFGGSGASGGSSTVETGVTSVDVSVIVPNYNYAAYLPERLNSILSQTVLPREIIFIDDASEDNSVEIARSVLEHSNIPFVIEANPRNLGVYANWRKGIAKAQGEFVWIAEADDSCEPEFLETLLAPMSSDEDVVISYTQSRRIDKSGATTALDNLAHTEDIDSRKWTSDYVELGVREVVDAIAFRNTIPNVSGCVLRRASALKAADVLDAYRYCGDWAFYATMLQDGRIAYHHRALSAFRRHDQSQTRRSLSSSDFLVEVARVREHICAHFPVRSCMLPKLDRFVNKDYKIENVSSNSEHGPVKNIFESARRHAEPRKLFAFVTTNNGSYSGGSEVLWREAAMTIRSAGHDVVVLIRNWQPSPRFFQEFERCGIKLYFKEDGGFDKMLGHRPDLVVISTGDQDEGIEYFGELTQRGIRYVIVNQLTKEERFWPIREEKLESVREGYRGAARVYFTCRNNHRVMERRIGARLENADFHFNPFHIDRDRVPAFPPTESGYSIAVPSKLLYVHKGQDLLIEVLSAKKWRERPVNVNIYGIGPDREKMEQSVRELQLNQVVFKGRVPDISEIWTDNHALLMPSRMEGLPIMLVSAMLSARVPIVTDVGGHAELVEDGSCGFVAADPAVECIDEAMERAWTVREQWESYGERARERVLDFLPEDPVSDFVSKIERVMIGRRKEMT